MNKKLFALAVMALVCLLAFSSCGRIADTDTSTNDEKPNDNIQNTDTTDNDTSSDKETTQKSYASVLFYLDGGTMIDASSLEKKVELYTMLSSPSIPVKEGYRFVGWSVDGTLVSFPYPITKNTVFNAVWSLNDDTDIDTGVNTDTDTDTSIEESTDSKKYDYDMNEYISLPNYKNHIVDLELDSLQMAIDTYLRNNATEYVVSRGDDIYVDITVYEANEITAEDGSTFKIKGSQIDELSKTNYFVENLGVSDLPYAIEIDIINSTLTISDVITRTFKYDQLEDYCPEAYEGKEFYFEIKITDKIIAEGDVVDVDFRGYYIDDYGNILKDSDGENVSPFSEGENSRFFIGSKLAIDDFENNLVGETIGEEFSFYATFPYDYS